MDVATSRVGIPSKDGEHEREYLKKDGTESSGSSHEKEAEVEERQTFCRFIGGPEAVEGCSHI